MGGDSIAFGDVIEFDGKQLVFLLPTLDTVYLAIMPNRNMSVDFSRRREAIFADPQKADREKGKMMWCFIQLTTEAFKDRIAFYALRNSDCSVEDLAAIAKIGTLNDDDKKELQKEILADDAVTRELQEAVAKIVLG